MTVRQPLAITKRDTSNEKKPKSWWADHCLGGDNFLLQAASVADVIDAEKDDGVRHTGLSQGVAVKALHAAIAADVVQYSVAAKTLVHHAKHLAAPCDETSG